MGTLSGFVTYFFHCVGALFYYVFAQICLTDAVHLSSYNMFADLLQWQFSLATRDGAPCNAQLH